MEGLDGTIGDGEDARVDFKFHAAFFYSSGADSIVVLMERADHG